MTRKEIRDLILTDTVNTQVIDLSSFITKQTSMQLLTLWTKSATVENPTGKFTGTGAGGKIIFLQKIASNEPGRVQAEYSGTENRGASIIFHSTEDDLMFADEAGVYSCYVDGTTGNYVSRYDNATENVSSSVAAVAGDIYYIERTGTNTIRTGYIRNNVETTLHTFAATNNSILYIKGSLVTTKVLLNPKYQ